MVCFRCIIVNTLHKSDDKDDDDDNLVYFNMPMWRKHAHLITDKIK